MVWPDQENTVASIQCSIILYKKLAILIDPESHSESVVSVTLLTYGLRKSVPVHSDIHFYFKALKAHTTQQWC